MPDPQQQSDSATSPPSSRLSPQDFASRIRSKYPGTYDDVDDVHLTRRTLAKYPDYKDMVDLPDLDKPIDAGTVSGEAKKFGLRLTSGQRSPAHNAAVGGAKNSYHLSGNAYDYAGPPDQMKAFYDHMRDTYGGRIPEIIHGSGDHTDHVHVAFGASGQSAKPLLDEATHTLSPSPDNSLSDWNKQEVEAWNNPVKLKATAPLPMENVEGGSPAYPHEFSVADMVEPQVDEAGSVSGYKLKNGVTPEQFLASTTEKGLASIGFTPDLAQRYKVQHGREPLTFRRGVRPEDTAYSVDELLKAIHENRQPNTVYGPGQSGDATFRFVTPGEQHALYQQFLKPESDEQAKAIAEDIKQRRMEVAQETADPLDKAAAVALDSTMMGAQHLPVVGKNLRQAEEEAVRHATLGQLDPTVRGRIEGEEYDTPGAEVGRIAGGVAPLVAAGAVAGPAGATLAAGLQPLIERRPDEEHYDAAGRLRDGALNAALVGATGPAGEMLMPVAESAAGKIAARAAGTGLGFAGGGTVLEPLITGEKPTAQGVGKQFLTGVLMGAGHSIIGAHGEVEEPHHSHLQPRNEAGQFDGPPVKAEDGRIGAEVLNGQQSTSDITRTAAGRNGLEDSQSRGVGLPADAKVQADAIDPVQAQNRRMATQPSAQTGTEARRPTGQLQREPDGNQDTSTPEDWLSQNIKILSDHAERSGLADKIEQMAAERNTANEIAKSLGTDRETVLAVRARRGIPSMDDKTEFEAWLSKRSSPQSEPQLLASDATGLKKSAVNAEREARAADPIDEEGARHWPGIWDKVKAEVASGARDPLLLAKELNKTKRPVTDEEVATLLHGKRRTADLHREAMTAVEDAIAKGDETAETAARVRAGLVEADRDTIEQAARSSMRENARGMSMMRGMVKDDYSLVNMIQRAKVARGERDLPPEVRAKLETLSKQIAEKDAALEKQGKELADLQAKKSIQRDIDRESRQQRRAQKKEEIDEEWADLQGQFDEWAKKAVSTTHAGIPVDGAKIIARMAKNRIQSGIVSVDGLIDEIYGKLKDKIDGLSREDVRDTLAQYGVSGKPSEVDLKAQLHELKRQLGELPRRTPDQNQNAAKTRLRNNIAQLQGQIARGEYTRPAKRSPIEYDHAAKRLEADRNRLRQQVESEIAKQELAKRGTAQKLADFIVKLHQEVVLSSTNVFAKLGGAALGRIGTQPIEQGIASGWAKVMPGVAAKAPIEGGFSKAVEGEALKRTFDKNAWREARNELPPMLGGKGGTDLATLHDPKASTTPEEIRFFGHIHGALKVPAKLNTFHRAFGKQVEYEIRQQVANGATPEEAQAYVQRPEVQMVMAGKAYEFAQQNILMGDNWVSRQFSKIMNDARNMGQATGNKPAQVAGRSVEFIGRFLFPVTKVAPNFVNEVLSYSPAGFAKAGIQGSGLIKAKLQGAEAFQKALSSLKPEDADYIMRNMSKATMGTAVMVLGFALRDNIGGYYNPDDARNRSKDKPDFGGMTIKGWKVPRAFLHTPVLEMLQIGATIGHVYDKARASRQGIVASGAIAAGEGGKEAGWGLAEEIPFFGQPIRILEETKKIGIGRVGAKLLGPAAMIPPDVQRVSRSGLPFGGALGDLDRRGEVRKTAPRTVGQDIKNVVPVARRSVPPR